MKKMHDELGDPDNVVHYVRPNKMLGDKVNGATFRPREKECGPSVNWLEYFDGTKDLQVDQARDVIPMKLSSKGVLAELNVGETKKVVQEWVSLRLVRTNDPEDHPSHYEILGLIKAPSQVYDLIAKNITNTHPGSPTPKETSRRP